MRRTILVILVIIISLLGNLKGNIPSFEQISLEQGLPGNNVHAVYQDSKGLIWMAIESVGLCKYDGRNFTVFSYSVSDSQSISCNFPTCITEDYNGYIWVDTTDGLNRFDRNTATFKRYYKLNDDNNSIPDNYINHLFTDRNGNIWISTRKGLGKYCVADKEFSQSLIGEADYTEGKPAHVSSVFEDNNGNIWIASYSSGLFLIETYNAENKRKHYTNSVEAPKRCCDYNISKHWLPVLNDNSSDNNYSILEICQYDKDNLLLGKYNGLYLFNIHTQKFKVTSKN